jgi:ABC-type multidrug transport system ATPase subunit
VQEALYKNLSGRSVVIIAHRLSTVERANRIIFINKGEVVEQGTHADLIQRGGKYAKLVQRQLLALDIGMQEDLSSKPSVSLMVDKDKTTLKVETHQPSSKDGTSFGSFQSLNDGTSVDFRDCYTPRESPTFGTPKFVIGSADSTC